MKIRLPAKRIYILVFVLATLFHPGKVYPQEMGKTKDCLKCHPALKNKIAAQKSHDPVKKRQCTLCHNPHAGNIDKLLVRPREELCLGCHKDFSKSLPNAFTHDPVQKGECLKCHDPHSSPRPKLLAAKPIELCDTCHQAKGFLTRKVIHKPLGKKKQCAICHDVHGSGYAYLLKNKSPQLCLTCHQIAVLESGNGHQSFNVKDSSCVSCHSSHSSDREGLILANLHQPYEKKQCRQCHQGDPAQGKMQKPDEKLCLGCHQKVADDFQKSFRHTLGGRQNYCLNCHYPHGSDGPGLRRGKDKNYCLPCHQDVEWKLTGTGKKEFHPLRRKNQCTACHRPHGSDYRLFFESTIETTCSGCHTHQSKFRHPIGESAKDPRNKKGMTCLSCHNPMGADYPFNLLFERSRELCIQCHKR